MKFWISISVILYITILLESEFLLLLPCPKKKRFALRFVLSSALFYAVCFGLGVVAEWLSVLFTGFELYDTLSTLIFFTVVFFLSIPLILFCWKVDLRTAFFYATAGYCMEHMSNAFVGIVRFVLELFFTIPLVVDRIVLSILLKGIIVVLLYRFIAYPFRKKNRMNTHDNRILVLSMVNSFICIILSVFRLYGFGETVNHFTSTVICGLYAIFACMLCLLMQLGIFRESSLLEDNLALEQLLKDEAKKHELSKSTVDLINIKVHDLKYQLHCIENNGGEATKEVLDEIYESFAIYDSMVKTGDEVFDIIIMNIWPLLIKNNIQFTYMVDGEALSVLQSTDISSLFGNLIDNAIECVLKEAEEKRVISLNVHKERQFLFIHIHNACTVSPEFENGLPVTTKNDTRYHGIGVRSIRYLIEKYNGAVKMSWEDGVYSVDIII